MAYKTTLERAEEAEFELTKSKAISSDRAHALHLAERRIEELEQANKQLLQKLKARGTE